MQHEDTNNETRDITSSNSAAKDNEQKSIALEGCVIENKQYTICAGRDGESHKEEVEASTVNTISEHTEAEDVCDNDNTNNPLESIYNVTSQTSFPDYMNTAEEGVERSSGEGKVIKVPDCIVNNEEEEEETGNSEKNCIKLNQTSEEIISCPKHIEENFGFDILANFVSSDHDAIRHRDKLPPIRTTTDNPQSLLRHVVKEESNTIEFDTITLNDNNSNNGGNMFDSNNNLVNDKSTEKVEVCDNKPEVFDFFDTTIDVDEDDTSILLQSELNTANIVISEENLFSAEDEMSKEKSEVIILLPARTLKGKIISYIFNQLNYQTNINIPFKEHKAIKITSTLLSEIGAQAFIMKGRFVSGVDGIEMKYLPFNDSNSNEPFKVKKWRYELVANLSYQIRFSIIEDPNVTERWEGEISEIFNRKDDRRSGWVLIEYSGGEVASFNKQQKEYLESINIEIDSHSMDIVGMQGSDILHDTGNNKQCILS